MSRTWKYILILSLLGNLSIVYVTYKALEYRAHINFFLDKYQQVTAEFSARAVYAEDNRRLVADTTVAGRLVFFGTQVIEEWDLPDYFADYETINRGVSGQRIGGYLLRFRPDVIELRPEAVIIEVSSYNLRAEVTVREVADYVASMAELSRAHNIVPILTTGIPLQKGADDFGEYIVMDSLAAYNRWLVNHCRETGILYVDFNMILADAEGFLNPELAANMVEPNDEGYRQLAEATREVLRQLR